MRETAESALRRRRNGPGITSDRPRFRAAIERMRPYVPGEQPAPGERLIKLNTNENPYPPAPEVRRALRRAAVAPLGLYPAPRATEFISEASRLYGFKREMILAGNGSDELLGMIFRAVLGSGDRVAYPVPTYSLYDTLAAIQQARVAALPYDPGFAIPILGLARTRARLTIVCNPNSPSGTMVSPKVLEHLARRLDGRFLVIDEAYVDFADSHALGLVRKHSNVLVLRSLSKSFSLAGMRLGLCFAHPEIIDGLLKVKDSYNLSAPAIAAGAQALRCADWMRANVARVKRTRARAEQALSAMGFRVPPSSANFVWAALAGCNLGPVAEALRRCGILVRHFPLLPDGLRISIGKPVQMRALFKELRPLVEPLVRAASDGRGRGRG